MLLLLKTNDLLRGLETYFNTRSSNSAFIHMTKCCIKLINSYERDTKNKEMKFNKYNNIPLDLLRFFKINFNFKKFCKKSNFTIKTLFIQTTIVSSLFDPFSS